MADVTCGAVAGRLRRWQVGLSLAFLMVPFLSERFSEGLRGLLALYLAGDKLPHDQIAAHLTKVIPLGVDLPPDVPGWGCD